MSILKSKLRQLNNWLHLWLGLGSGIIVFIVSITGCISVFEQEIKDALEPWRFVEAQDKDFVPPSQLIDTALVYMPGKTPTGLTYEDQEGAAAVGFWHTEDGARAFSVVFMNPYTGAFIKKQTPVGKGAFDFFHFIMDGHRELWLPHAIGRPIVGVATLIFLALLITGLVLWWPKKWKKSNVKKAFSIKTKNGFRKLNYDLHNVLGYYALIFALVVAITGLVWSFQWFENSVYYLTSGGKSQAEHAHPHSDVSMAGLSANDSIPAIDRAFYKTLEQEPNPQRIYMTPGLSEADESIEIAFFKYKGKFYNHNTYFYDRYTVKPLRIAGDRYTEASFADQLAEMNYDLHTGSIWGLPGKILAFLVSLICASLPVTGFLVWFKKRQSSKSQQRLFAAKFAE